MLRRRLFSKITVAEIPYAQAVVGDIYCSDNTIVSASNYSASGKTAVGIVINNVSGDMRVMALTPTQYIYGTYLTDLALENRSTLQEALQDYDGTYNSSVIILIGGADTLAYQCSILNISGVSGWHLGAVGEFLNWVQNKTTIDASRTSCGFSAIPVNSVISTSTEQNSESSWYYYNNATPMPNPNLPKYVSYPTYALKKITY